MAERWVILRVTVTEEDGQGDVLSRLCDNREARRLAGTPESEEQLRAEACRWAYEGFNVARNGALGLLRKSAESDPPAPTVKLLVLKTGQLDAVRAFYQALGITFTRERHGTGSVHFAGRSGVTVLEVYPLPEGTTADRTTRLGFNVRDLDRVLAELHALGTPVIRPPEESAQSLQVFAVVRDPDGRTVELYQEPVSGWEVPVTGLLPNRE